MRLLESSYRFRDILKKRKKSLSLPMHAPRKNHVRSQEEGSCLQTRKRALTQN